MPRIVKNKDLIARGARLKNGGALAEHTKPQPAPEPVETKPEVSPVVAAPTIDVEPMTAAVERLVDVVGDAMKVQADALRTIAAKPDKPPVFPAWEFRVTYNESGRIDLINAKAT